jgi:hypothetical protein
MVPILKGQRRVLLRRPAWLLRLRPPCGPVWTKPRDAEFMGPVSTDGPYLAYGSLMDLDIYVRDLENGTSRRVTNENIPFPRKPGVFLLEFLDKTTAGDTRR